MTNHADLCARLRTDCSIDDLETAADLIESLVAERDDLLLEKKARSMIDPVTRLHNLCDGLAESRHDSPYSAESWDLQDAAYREKCAENKRLAAENEALRADATRYQWLRAIANRHWTSDYSTPYIVSLKVRYVPKGVNGYAYEAPTSDAFDAAIDAALASKQ